MKIVIDTLRKTVEVQEPVNLEDLIKELQSLLGDKIKEYSLVLPYSEPVVIERWVNPVNPINPWGQPIWVIPPQVPYCPAAAPSYPLYPTIICDVGNTIPCAVSTNVVSYASLQNTPFSYTENKA